MAELTATIDIREKTGTGRIVEEAVPLILEGERFEFFMTNDYATISGKMKSLGYWQPTAFELKPIHPLTSASATGCWNWGRPGP